MIDILAELFQKSDEDEIDSIYYFLVGDIAADYRHIRLGMGEELTKYSISLALGLCKEEVEAKFQRIGDLGSLAARLEHKPEKKFSEYFEIEALSVKFMKDY
jgi:hypothetical protein